jgi:hypothetical protein
MSDGLPDFILCGHCNRLRVGGAIVLWILPGFFALFGLPLVLFPRFIAERHTHISKFQPEEVLRARAASCRVMGAIFLLTAAVLAGLIGTSVLR